MSTDTITKQREAELFAAEQLQAAYEEGFFTGEGQKDKTVLEGGFKAVIVWYPRTKTAYCYVYNMDGIWLAVTEWRL